MSESNSNQQAPKPKLKPVVKPEAYTVHPPILWQDGDMLALRQFISDNPKFLVYLADRTPRISDKSLDDATITGLKHSGYEELFQVLRSMTEETTSPQEDSPYIS